MGGMRAKARMVELGNLGAGEPMNSPDRGTSMIEE